MNHREIQEEMLKNAEEKWSHNQHKDLRNAPRFVAPHGTLPLMNDAIGRNFNNTQGNISSNMNADLHTNHATRTDISKLPLAPTQTHSSTKPPLAPVREQDRYLPIANVVRIMKRTIPRNGKVSEEAKETMLESVSEFIGFITSEANVGCQKEFRKTVTAEDIIAAMSKLGLDHYVEPLTMYLRKYRESEADPKVPRHAAGNMDFEAAVASAPNVSPSFPVIDLPTSMFASPGNRGIYHGGSIGMSQGLYTAPVSDGSGTSLALGIDGGPSASEGVNVEPLTMYLRKYRESEADPKVPRRAAGYMDFEAAVASAPNVLPSFPVVEAVDLPTSMFASPGNRGIYHGRSIGTSQGSYTAPVSDGSETSLALGSGGGPRASEGVDVEPLTMYLRKYHESEADPRVPRRAAGNMDFDAAVASAPNVLPFFPVVDPPTSVFASPGNRGIYHGGSIGTSQGLYTAPVSAGSGTSLALGSGGGPSASEGVDVEPLTMYLRKYHESEADPKVPRRAAGNMDFDAAVASAPNVLPFFPVVDPPTSVFASPGNRGIYHGGSIGTSQGLYTAVSAGSGTSLALGSGGGPSASEGVDVEPLTMYLRKYHESEADPKVPRRAAGNMDFDAAVASAPNVLPFFPVVDPPTSVFASPGNRGIYHGESIGTSQGLYTAPVSAGSGTSLALGSGVGPSASEGVDVEPLTMYLRKYHESEADPKVPRRAAGNMDFDAAVASAPNVLPFFPVVDPPTSVFASPGNRGIYHGGSIGMSQGLYTAPVSAGSGTSLALGSGGGPSASGVGPSEPPQAGQYFYNPYGHYRN